MEHQVRTGESRIRWSHVRLRIRRGPGLQVHWAGNGLHPDKKRGMSPVSISSFLVAILSLTLSQNAFSAYMTGQATKMA